MAEKPEPAPIPNGEPTTPEELDALLKEAEQVAAAGEAAANGTAVDAPTGPASSPVPEPASQELPQTEAVPEGQGDEAAAVATAVDEETASTLAAAADGLQEAEARDAMQAAAEADRKAAAAGFGDLDPQSMGLPDLAAEAAGGRDAVQSIEMLNDVNLRVRIELGRTKMFVEDVLRLGEGSVVELDKLAGDPVDVFVNERLVARGEVLVLNDNFCVRVSEIVSDENERLIN
jgi:flagellar motor switch protein FliN/FliY